MNLQEYKETIREHKRYVNKNVLFDNIFLYAKDVAIEKLKEKVKHLTSIVDEQQNVQQVCINELEYLGLSAKGFEHVRNSIERIETLKSHIDYINKFIQNINKYDKYFEDEESVEQKQTIKRINAYFDHD
jgi:hypothetical protein